MPLLQLSGVSKRYPGRELFAGVNLTLLPADRIGLVGDNGSGKTTILRMIAGHGEPDEGEIHRDRRSSIGYLPQELTLDSRRTVLEETLSGAAEIQDAEKHLHTLYERVGTTEEDLSLLAEVQTSYEQADGYRLETRAKRILAGLGFPSEGCGRPCSELSGGWRMRVELAKLLLRSPAVLLLDEPTNHLDIEALRWLEEELGRYPGALVLVSHDRYFLNSLATTVAHLHAHKLRLYPGNYEVFTRRRAEEELQLEHKASQEQRRRQEIERFVERFRAKATKASQVQSRIKQLEKMEQTQLLERDDRVQRFRFPQPKPSGRSVARFERVALAYGTHQVYQDIDLILERGTRLALVGPNGAGKSTTIKLLAGRLSPTAGKVELGHNVSRYYYAQHLIEELDPGATPYQELVRLIPDRSQTEVRSMLGVFGFHGEHVFVPVSELSGGEKARLALAKILAQPPNFLILDEPTNHLDMKGKEALERALQEYSGTICFVSHDRYFIDRLATSVLEIRDGRFTSYPGNYSDYLASLAAAQLQAGPVQGLDSEVPVVAPERKERKRAEAEVRHRRFAVRRGVEARLTGVEEALMALEARIAEIDTLLAASTTYRDTEKVRELAEEKRLGREHLARLNADWEALGEELAGLQE
ncbi:MAG: hypothetical protein A2284_15670 [Deltaproteobacteria bacterium RIFOXYA12_FULL_61_11]|nr:MAG: hypothetical protein A2284_15670 [Deltaproteobacteria bacterium RIFOXYA12_FULL_61_11]